MLLMAPTLAVAAPLVVVLGAIVVGRLRAQRIAQAGWLLVGASVPVAVAWLVILVGGGGGRPVPPAGVAWLVGAAATGLAGAGLVARGDPQAPPPDTSAPAGQPGSRALGSIAAAIREPGMVGPFGLPELSMLVAFVLTWIVVPFLLPRDAHWLIQITVPSLVAAVVAAEAYIRSMPPRSRRAFEAFSWLGEWELARAQELSGRPVPTSPEEARRWLAERPERVDRLDEAALRVEVLVLAGEIDDARSLVERMHARTATGWERFEVAALRDLVDWRSGGEGDLPGMAAAAEAIQPIDSDDRLRADVTVAVARVRRRMADGRSTPGDAAEPLVEVRERLGDRAKGQVGRALRRRIVPLLFVLSVVFGLLTVGLQALG
jgi:hypothetical protein